MILATVIALVIAAVVFFVVAKVTHSVWVDPARLSLKPYETHSHVEGERYEVLFTPYEPAVFMHDPARENYTLIINAEGFGLKASFPCSLYSRHHPLFFLWDSVTSVERFFLTNVLVKVQQRQEGFYLYAGIKAARRLLEEWTKHSES